MPERSDILIEALPYIQKYYKKTVVIKYGGNAMINEELSHAVMSDIVLLSLVGVNVVLVHGGGPEISDLLKKTGKESRFINGLRYTDTETMDYVQMVLCGKIGKSLAATINRTGGRALSLCGLDGGMIKAKKLSNDGIDYGLVGEITSIDPRPVLDTISSGYLPVISTVAQGEDADTAYNINSDTAAAKLAISINAEKLILLTDVSGLMNNPDDKDSLIPVVHLSEIPGLIKDGIITGGMIPKIDCCLEAVRHGVKSASILDGRIPHSIILEMLTDEGSGTIIY
ncbi:MAG: acetylglutamate kinase [Erysipelotrichaceae bacterium]|nr:acetylglutamate kinase [Erysipelotrichaceae bacterium]